MVAPTYWITRGHVPDKYGTVKKGIEIFCTEFRTKVHCHGPSSSSSSCPSCLPLLSLDSPRRHRCRHPEVDGTGCTRGESPPPWGPANLFNSLWPLCPTPESFGPWCLSGICGTGPSRIVLPSPNWFSSEGQQLPTATRPAGLARMSPAPSLHALLLKDVNTYIFSYAALVFERHGVGSGATRTNFLPVNCRYIG